MKGKYELNYMIPAYVLHKCFRPLLSWTSWKIVCRLGGSYAMAHKSFAEWQNLRES